MELEDNLDVIGVLRAHLEEIYAALRNARMREEALDLAEAARLGKNQVKHSVLTRKLNNAVRHVEGYLAVTPSDDVSED